MGKTDFVPRIVVRFSEADQVDDLVRTEDRAFAVSARKIEPKVDDPSTKISLAFCL